MLGMSAGLWGYNSAVIPTIPPYAPWNFSLLPVAAMLFYQFMPRIKPVIKSAVFAGFAAFVCEPFFSWLRIYDPKNWRHYYSFPIFIAIYLIGYYFANGKHYEPL
jgi:predicted PurR-regulated permease PerM